jgi:hypothetical protein
MKSARQSMTIPPNSLKFATDYATSLAPTATRVYLTRGKFDRRLGQRYNAHLGSPDGGRIVTDALDVEFAACRALKARGATGRMETWRPGSTYPDMLIADIAEAATGTILENERRGPNRVKHRPWAETGLSRRSSPATGPGIAADPLAL